ncbi:MAG: hypothetical protein LBS31_12820 [Candidatus Adiutrix sp.]|jgi:hypothetical protein|nr:hypothetical protein [Candidatus Adiutrix sp.]
MLNESYELHKTLRGAGIKLDNWHREYKPIPKTPCFRLWLSDDGAVEAIEAVSEELAVALRKFGDNQSTFPAFNIAPLYRLTEARQISELERFAAGKALLDIDKLKSWRTSDNWRDSDKKLPDLNKKVYNCVVTRSEMLLKAIKKQDAALENSITKLIKLTRTYAERTDGGFRSALEACVLKKLQNRENVGLYLQFLFHIGDEKKPHKDDRGALSVILDFAGWEGHEYPIANEHTTEWINEVLLKADGGEEAAAGAGDAPDAFGAPYAHVGEPMPSVKLKGFEATLRSMFNAQRCQYRYGKIDDESYPISKSNRDAAKQSLEWIAKPENEGVTWRTADQNEIVFAYPSVLPGIPLKFASFFAARRDDGEQTEARFENIAEEMLKTLKGLLPKEIPENIHVFSIRKMDKARSRVVFNRNYSPKWFLQAAEEWRQGCKNLPEMDIRAFPPPNPGDSAKPLPKQMGEFKAPFPLQVPGIINNVWKRNGKTTPGKAAVKRARPYQGLELLLDPVQETSFRYYLNILLSHSMGLIQYVGGQQHQALASSNRQANEIGGVLSVLGLLLCKCGYTKEEYMENTAYLIGQILKISDELHAFYCEIKRDGDVPPQLAGNSVFAAATETPVAAIAQLGIRMNPYISWAKQHRTKPDRKEDPEKGVKEPWRASRLLNLYEATAAKLHALLTAEPARFNDFEKAQVFIGYLAAFPKNKNTTESKENNNED